VGLKTQANNSASKKALEKKKSWNHGAARAYIFRSGKASRAGPWTATPTHAGARHGGGENLGQERAAREGAKKGEEQRRLVWHQSQGATIGEGLRSVYPAQIHPIFSQLKKKGLEHLARWERNPTREHGGSTYLGEAFPSWLDGSQLCGRFLTRSEAMKRRERDGEWHEDHAWLRSRDLPPTRGRGKSGGFRERGTPRRNTCARWRQALGESQGFPSEERERWSWDNSGHRMGHVEGIGWET